MTAQATVRLHELSSTHPEWTPWLSVVELVLSAAGESAWEECVPKSVREDSPTPLLARASVTLPITLLEGWVRKLFHTAAASGTPELASLHAVTQSAFEATELFRAALTQNSPRLDRMALDCGVQAGVFRGVAEFVPRPFLHACGRVWADTRAQSWDRDYCPICGAWPALAEVRGIEKARYLRCGRCGSDWPAYGMHCIYCGNDDHERLTAFVPQNGVAPPRIESCKACNGYLKSFNTLQGADPSAVMLDDLASVDLDIAALDQGLHRPAEPGYRINPAVSFRKDAGRNIFSWRR